MSAFFYTCLLQWKTDLRDRNILVTYYLVPLLFFLFMGNIFTTINPSAGQTLLQSMTVFCATMGAMLGTPLPLVELFGSPVKKAYRAGGVPLWSGVVCNAISALIHLFTVSLVLLLLSPSLFEAQLPPSTGKYFFALLLFLFTSIAAGTLLGLLVKTSSKLAVLAQAVFLPSVMLSGIMFPVSMLPKPLELVGRLLPASAGFALMTSSQTPVWALCVLLLGAAVLFLLIGIRLKSLLSN